MLNVLYLIEGIIKGRRSIKKFFSASGAPYESWPSHFQVVIRIPHGHGLSPGCSDVSFLASANSIY